MLHRGLFTSKAMSSRGLGNPATFRRFMNWMERNCEDIDQLSKIDIDAEFGKDLSFNEAIEMALHKFPTLWKGDSMKEFEQRPKQIVFVKDLSKRIQEGKIRVTYRKSPKIGTYYVIENRFKQNANSAKLLIEFYQSDKVDPYKLSDDEASLAGIQTAGEIRTLFEKWYGRPIPTLYRNWFRLKDG